MRKRENPFHELEELILAAIDDAVARITADIDKLVAALAAATGTGTTDTANATALNAASDRAEAALSPPVVTPPGTTPGTVVNPPLVPAADSGALTAPA
jgi:hypothetical protein